MVAAAIRMEARQPFKRRFRQADGSASSEGYDTGRATVKFARSPCRRFSQAFAPRADEAGEAGARVRNGPRLEGVQPKPRPKKERRTVAFTINTNIASMQAQEYLRVTQEFQSKTISRVTSGLRIVSSGDDAAGLAIANGFRSDQAVLTQGIRNANDGLATLQTIDSGINNISKLLDRARTLATQSASGTFNGNREVLNSEFQSVIEEINRQAKAIGLNQGGDFAKNLSVFIGGGRGSNDAEIIQNGSVSVDLRRSTVDARSLGLSGYSAASDSTYDLSVYDNGTANDLESAIGGATSMTFNLSGVGFDDTTITVNLTGVQDLKGLVDAINAGIESASGGSSPGAVALRNANITAQINADGKGFSLVSPSSAFTVEAGADAAARRLFGLTAAANVKVAGGLEARSFTFTAVTGSDTQRVTISAVGADGSLQSVDVTLNATNAGTAEAAADTINAALLASNKDGLMKIVAAEAGDGTNRITFASTSSFKIVVQSGTGAVGLNGGTAITSDSTTDFSSETTLDSSGGANLSISTQQAAEKAVNALAVAVKKLGEAQAVVGKGQNQFNFAVSLASTQLTNLAASESRIRDADLAFEAANLTKAQILTQAGVAALAQANAAPQAVLTLLRG
ncbi:MAG: flagellin [Bryobacteraceae bacterium]